MALLDVNREGKSSKVSESITLRFDKKTLDELRDEAKQRLESINTLLNQVVKSYVKWHKPARNSGLIYVNKFLYKDLIEQISDESLKALTRNYAQNYFKDTIEMFNHIPSVEFYLEYLINWLQISGFNYRIDQEDPGYITIKIQLDMGLKFSKFMSYKITNILENLGNPKVNFEVTDHLVKVQIFRSTR